MKKNLRSFFPRVKWIALLLFSVLAIKASGQNYKDWDYTPHSVFGLIKLDNTTNRTYYKITRPDAQTARVKEINAAGVTVNTTVVRFFNGSLKLVSETDQWGKTYQTTRFTFMGNGVFNVTETNTGKNNNLPCKSVRYIYKNDLLAEKRYLSYAGKLCVNAYGFAVEKYKRLADKDRFSLIAEHSFYDADGNPVVATNYDCHKMVYDRDARGNELSVAYYGTNDEPLTNRFGGFKNRFTYDQYDNYITYEYIGLNDEVAPNAYGTARYEYKYKNGFIILQTRYDDKGKVTLQSAAGDGVAILKNEVDDNGNTTAVTYYDENGQPINCNSGYQKIVYKYNPANMLVSIEYFDKNQAPAIDASNIHQYKYERDEQGRVTQMAYFDKNNSPIKNKLDEVYMIKYKYDEAGRKASESYWQNAETKMLRWNGYHEYLVKYNPDGQETELTYFDDKGNLSKSNDGYSRRLIKYDANANISEIGFFDNATPIITNGALVSNYHCIRYFYDKIGRRASLEYFDDADKPANASINFTDKISCHKIEFVYQGNRIIQENCYLANSDTPVKIIDCLHNDSINTFGISYGYKNQ
jgi:hypothetical protein